MMRESMTLSQFELGFPWTTFDPFLFCVHHDDAYPAGNDAMGPAASLRGRNLGMDFEGIDGWRMYHGDVVPGFPRHPHRGFETITICRQGYIDHSDSLGATARFGAGDVQWMTAGKGIVHSEMFPLTQRDAPNPVELFQIWLNLPQTDKMVEPSFKMSWSPTIPTVSENGATVRVFAGELHGAVAPSSPPNSWAAKPESHVAIYTLKLEPQARFSLRSAPAGVDRTLYFFEGATASVGGTDLHCPIGVRLPQEVPVELVNGDASSQWLLLQGRPIGEPVAWRGPFVMNTQREIFQAIDDYHRTEFGGWPWPKDGPVHAREQSRFAIHADGHRDAPSSTS